MTLKCSFFWKNAGLISIWNDKGEDDPSGWALHIIVSPKFLKWGYSVEEYDLCMDYYGFWPLFLLARTY